MWDFRNRPWCHFYLRNASITPEMESTIKTIEYLRPYGLIKAYGRSFYDLSPEDPYFFGINKEKDMGITLFGRKTLKEIRGVRII